MPDRAIRAPSCIVASALLAAILLLVPLSASAQPRWRSVTLQAGVAGGPNNFVGGGLSVSGEVGIVGQLRAALQWTDWEALLRCSVNDAPSECEAHAGLWELGIRQGLGVAPRVAPYVGAGLGLYRRRRTGSDLTMSPYASVAVGIDIRPGSLITMRLSFVHQEVLHERFEGYPSRQRFTGMLLGIGLAMW